MPKLYEYKNRDGFYIKTRIKGRMVTYQLTETGADILTENNYGHLDEIPFSVLHKYRELGLIYTGNSGPSELLDDDNDYQYVASEEELEQEKLSEEELDRIEESLHLRGNDNIPEYDTQEILPPLVVEKKQNEKSSRNQKRGNVKTSKKVKKKQTTINGRRKKGHIVLKNPIASELILNMEAAADISKQKHRSAGKENAPNPITPDDGDQYWLEPVLKVLIVLCMVLIIIYHIVTNGH